MVFWKNLTHELKIPIIPLILEGIIGLNVTSFE